MWATEIETTWTQVALLDASLSYQITHYYYILPNLDKAPKYNLHRMQILLHYSR